MVKKTATNSVKLNFDGVETGGFDVPDGAYVLKVSSVANKKSQESGNAYLSWEFKVSDGKYKGRKVWDNTSLQPQALWKLRGLLEALGMEIEDGEFEIDLGDFEAMEVGAEIVNEKYQGKDKPRIATYMPAEDVDSNGEEEGEEEEQEEEPEKPAPKASGTSKTTTSPSKKKSDPEPEEEEEEEVEEEAEPEPPKTTKKKVVKKEPEFTVGMAVTFEDEGKTMKGKIKSIGEEAIEVTVGKDVWELEPSELSAA